MANIHLNTNGNAHLNIGTGSNGGSMSTSNSSMPKYVGARAVVERVEEGIRIWMKDYLGETEEVIAEAIDSITTNPDGSLTFNLPNGDTLTTDSLKGPQGDEGPAGADGSDGADGVGIASIEKTSTAGLVDTYTITYTDGDTDTFTVTNGVSGAFEAEYNVTTYSDVKDAYDADEILVCTVDDSGSKMVLQLVYFDSANEVFYFALPMSDGWYWTQLSNADGWDDGQWNFASTDVATQLADGLMSALDKQKLDGLSKRNIWYGTCSTSASQSPKAITTASGDFSLTAGNMLCVLFSHTNSLSSVSLQVDGGASKSAYSMDGTSDISNRWGSNEVVMFVYDGTKFILLEQGMASTTQYGITKLNNTTSSTSTSEAATANAVKAAYDNGGVQSVNGSTGAVSLSIHNVPSGGTSGQVLSKASGTDYDLEWATPSSGSVTDVTVNGTSVVTGGVAAVDITGKSDVGHTHTTTDVTDFPSLADVATSGDYSDLNDIPYGKMIPYAESGTAGGTVQKTATISKITSLTTGTLIAVKFANSNAVANPTLKLNDFNAKSIKRYGTTAPSTSAATSWNSGSVVLLLYDGTYWQIVGFLNSTYSEISEANITNGTGSSTGLASGRRVKKAVETFAPVKDVTLDGTSVVSSGVAALTSPTIPVTDVTLDGTSVLSSGVAVLTSPTSTSTPTADTISEFDASAQMNSTDMSAQDVSDFVDSLNVSGGGITKTAFTTATGSNYANYGGCYYEVLGSLVHLHIGVSGLTASTGNNIGTIAAIAPRSSTAFGLGTGGATGAFVSVEVATDGSIKAYTSAGATYCGADLMYFI